MTKPTGTSKNSAINTELIRDLAEILNDTNLSDIEVEQGEMRIRVSRSIGAATIYTPPTVPAAASVVNVDTTPPVANEISKNAVSSPMVGTAYLAPAPGAEPFVKIGQKVTEGQTLLIIEAMKTMNQITSPRAGTVKSVLVSDAQPVEFGEPLVIVE